MVSHKSLLAAILNVCRCRYCQEEQRVVVSVEVIVVVVIIGSVMRWEESWPGPS